MGLRSRLATQQRNYARSVLAADGSATCKGTAARRVLGKGPALHILTGTPKRSCCRRWRTSWQSSGLQGTANPPGSQKRIRGAPQSRGPSRAMAYGERRVAERSGQACMRAPNRRQSVRSPRQGNPNRERGAALMRNQRRSRATLGGRHRRQQAHMPAVGCRKRDPASLRKRGDCQRKGGRCWGSNGARSCPWPKGSANTRRRAPAPERKHARPGRLHAVLGTWYVLSLQARPSSHQA